MDLSGLVGDASSASSMQVGQVMYLAPVGIQAVLDNQTTPSELNVVQ